MRGLLPAALALALAVGPQMAQAASTQEVRDARLAVDQGVDHFRAERYEDAVREFRNALAVIQDPLLVFNIARAYEELDDVRNAVHYFDKFVQDYADDAAAAEAAQRADALRPKLPGSLLIDCRRFPGAKLLVDGGKEATCGKRLRGLSPGQHIVEATAPGQRPWRSEVFIRPNARQDHRITWEKAPPAAAPAAPALKAAPAEVPAPVPSPPQQPAAAWAPLATAGVGLALMATGIAFGVLSSQAGGDYADLQARDRIRVEDVDEAAERSERHALVANVFLGTGALALITGGALWWTW